MPGFVDAHTHPLMHGQCSSWADLSGTVSVDEVVKVLREHAWHLEAGAAIRGFGYDQHRLSEDRHPTAADLYRVAADRPVVIMHTSGHGYVANSRALAEAGITAATPTPLGGLIGRDGDGNPLGRVFDSACDLLTGPDGVKITNHGPNFHLPDEHEALDARLDEAQDAFLAAGISTVGDCQVTDREMTNYLRARDAGRLRIRVSMYVLSNHVDGLRRLGVGSTLGDERLAIAGVKHYADGSLISGTAFLPCGCGATHGYLYHGDGELESLLAASSAAGLQTATHAQGPDAIELVLRGLEQAPRPDLRHRIEHCGFPTDGQIERMARLGVVPVPSPPRCSGTATGCGATIPNWPSACTRRGCSATPGCRSCCRRTRRSRLRTCRWRAGAPRPASRPRGMPWGPVPGCRDRRPSPDTRAAGRWRCGGRTWAPSARAYSPTW